MRATSAVDSITDYCCVAPSEITHICRYPREHGGLGLGEGKLLRNEVDCIDSQAICVMIVNQTTKPLRRFNTDFFYLMYTVKTAVLFYI